MYGDSERGTASSVDTGMRRDFGQQMRATDAGNRQEKSVTEVLPEKVVPQQFATDENQVLGQTVAPKIP